MILFKIILQVFLEGGGGAKICVFKIFSTSNQILKITQ